ncbi:hypothetical protein ABMA27_003691 [Loxostege sticticalis]|uniref:THAP-type domain-containing protein n=1 Tax=Loxostege sticticalis TaxID=481309 RepID=A0ABR3HPX2_LOXSC
MPSCVVKWCKNNTTSQKKCQGITFHRFPTGNEPWKDDWTRIIRNCGGQEDWSPSKSSVACSIHFDQNDLYTTSKRRRRLVTYATRIKLCMGEKIYVNWYPRNAHTCSVNVASLVSIATSQFYLPISYSTLNCPTLVTLSQTSCNFKNNRFFITSTLQRLKIL